MSNQVSCAIDGAFVILDNILPVGGAGIGHMALYRSHPNYREIISTLLLAKTTGLKIDIQTIGSSGSLNLPLNATGSDGRPCMGVPIIGAVGILS